MEIAILVLCVLNLVLIGALFAFVLKRTTNNTTVLREDVSHVYNVSRETKDMAEANGSSMNNVIKDLSEIRSSVQSGADVIESASEDIALQVAELKSLADGMRIDTIGLKGAFLMIASRVAAISDAAGGKLPAWIREHTSVGKVLDVENSSTGERLEFEYLENGDIKSRTYRGELLVCEVLHDNNGGVKEGTVFTMEGKPQKRFVYDEMGQVKEQKELEA